MYSKKEEVERLQHWGLLVYSIQHTTLYHALPDGIRGPYLHCLSFGLLVPKSNEKQILGQGLLFVRQRHDKSN